MSTAVLLGLTLMPLPQALFTYLPAMQMLFGTTSMSLEDWLRLLATAALITLAGALEKRFRKR